MSKDFSNIPCLGLATKSNGSKYGVSCGKDKKGLSFVYTHRARSSGYKQLSEVPLAKIKFIDSTG